MYVFFFGNDLASRTPSHLRWSRKLKGGKWIKLCTESFDFRELKQACKEGWSVVFFFRLVESFYFGQKSEFIAKFFNKNIFWFRVIQFIVWKSIFAASIADPIVREHIELQNGECTGSKFLPTFFIVAPLLSVIVWWYIAYSLLR